MSMRLVESYDDSEHTISVDGRTFPASCLIEDEQGIRWFLTYDIVFVSAHRWMRAAAAGAAGLLAPLSDGWAAMTTERFMEERADTQDGYTLPKQWSTFTFLPSYADVVNAPYIGIVREPVQAQAEAVEGSEDLGGVVHVHLHTEYSPLDGLSKAEEVMQAVVADGQKAAASTDHGTCAGHPEFQMIADKYGVKPIFGMEAYLVDDRLERPESGDVEAQKRLKDYYHICLWAMDNTGLRNLWAMSTESNRDGFYHKPRLDWDTLTRLNEGVLASTGCLRGPLSHNALLDGDEMTARARLARMHSIFEDRLYIELHTNHLEEQIKVNNDLVMLAREFDIPMVAASDSHYAVKEHQHAHRVWLSAQTNSDIADDSSLFAGGQDYHIQTEAEMREALAYLGQDVVDEAITNTVRLAARCNARIEGTPEPPVYSKVGGAEKDAERLLDLCLGNWHKTLGKSYSQEEAEARFEREFKLLVAKGFCGYFLMVSDQTRHARSNRILVGPGRGSGGGSLVAYLAEITDIDPLEADLLFERFMTEGRTALPDFDVDYPQSKKRYMQQYCRDKYGDDHVTVVGSVMRLKNKGVIKKLGGAMKSVLPESFFMDQKAISAIIADAEGDTAGLGLSWEDLWAKAGEELQPFRDQYPDLFEMCDLLVGRVSGYGQHAAGMVIATDQPLTGRIPMRRGDDSDGGHMIAQYDMRVLEDLGFVKFDLLTLRNLDTIQDCIDLIRERRGIDIDVYSWREEYADPQVWEEVSEAHTLGIFQIETTLGTRYAKRMRPKSLADLADLVTIVRPGPRNSGLTETYLRRRDGLEEITYPDPRLESVLAKTYGCLLYQEDIMAACMVLGGYDSNEADGIRKILGKKQVEKVAKAGEEFVSRAVERGMEAGAAQALWAQMAEFAKYSFNRAHAFAYAVLGYWCAWLKFHYPVEFLTAALSSVDKDRIPDFIKEARRMGFKVLPPDINESGKGFRAGPLQVRYGLDSIKGIGDAATMAITAAQPFTSFEDFMGRCVEPKGSKVDRGDVALLARIGAYDSLVPNRRALETMLLREKTGEATQCVHKTDGNPSFTWVSIGKKPEDTQTVVLPCAFDWDSEPDPVNPRTGKKTKKKNPPKKCTKACRNYTAPPPMALESVDPYTEADIRDIEMNLLGVFLSSTPFDRLAREDRDYLIEQAEAAEHGPQGCYEIAGILTKARPYRDSTGRNMGFLAVETEMQVFDVVCFNTQWEKYHRDFQVGGLVLAQVEKNSRGFSLVSFYPV